MKPELLIFDCDGVLVDSEGLASKVIHELLHESGIKWELDEVVKHFAGNHLQEALDDLITKEGQPIPDNFIQQYRERSFEAFKKDLKPIEGIEAVLKRIEMPFCVASNGPRNKIELNLTITNLLPYFNNRVFSAYEIEVWKPNPVFYLKICEFMGYAPDACVVVEDSRFGVEAAKNAGIRVLGYTGGDPFKQNILAQYGAITFDSMQELVRLIE